MLLTLINSQLINIDKHILLIPRPYFSTKRETELPRDKFPYIVLSIYGNFPIKEISIYISYKYSLLGSTSILDSTSERASNPAIVLQI